MILIVDLNNQNNKSVKCQILSLHICIYPQTEFKEIFTAVSVSKPNLTNLQEWIVNVKWQLYSSQCDLSFKCIVDLLITSALSKIADRFQVENGRDTQTPHDCTDNLLFVDYSYLLSLVLPTLSDRLFRLSQIKTGMTVRDPVFEKIEHLRVVRQGALLSRFFHPPCIITLSCSIVRPASFFTTLMTV